jgi:hypothetical protein
MLPQLLFIHVQQGHNFNDDDGVFGLNFSI